MDLLDTNQNKAQFIQRVIHASYYDCEIIYKMKNC